jgi:hypothetical protein
MRRNRHRNAAFQISNRKSKIRFARSFPVKTAASHAPSKTEDLLVSLAETVGSTLGTIAAKVDTAHKAFSKSDITGKIERSGKKLVRQSKKLVSGAVTSKKTRRATAAGRRAKHAVARRAKAVVRKAGTTAKRVKIRAKATAPRASRTKARSRR